MLCLMSVSRKHVTAVLPLMNGLVVEIGIGLGQKARKACLNAQLARGGLRVRCASRAPQVENDTGFVHCTDLGHYGGHRNALRTDGPDKRVINVYEYDAWFHEG